MDGLSWILFGHAAFQYLNAACELGLFDLLHTRGELSKEDIRSSLDLQPRAIDILLLGCTSLGMLEKDAELYRNADVVAGMVGTADWQRFQDTVAFEQYVVYEGQLDFTESLRTNSNAGIRRVPGAVATCITGCPRTRRLSRFSIGTCDPGPSWRTSTWWPSWTSRTRDACSTAAAAMPWTLEENTMLLRKAYEALNEGGRVVIFNSMSNDAGDGPVVAALDSVYFAALPAEGGMIYSWAQPEECLRAAGFRDPKRLECPGWTPHGIIVATR